MQRGRERRRPFEAFGDFAAIPDRGAQIRSVCVPGVDRICRIALVV
jgi:hypothetical protein